MKTEGDSMTPGQRQRLCQEKDRKGEYDKKRKGEYDSRMQEESMASKK